MGPVLACCLYLRPQNIRLHPNHQTAKKKPKTCKKNGIRKLDEEKEKGREIFEEEED
jgi:hypothetical protein